MGDFHSESLGEKIQSLMYEKKFKDILNILNSSENQSYVENQAMDLMSIICSIVKENKEFLTEPTHNEYCSEIIMQLTEKGNPKEILVGLLESADSFKEDEYFLFLLNPLKNLFIRMPGKRGRTLEWILNVLNAHLISLPCPENHDLKGEELLLMDLDPVVQRTSVVLSGYLDFLQFFIDEVRLDMASKTENDRFHSQRLTLQRYIVSILEYPLLHHDLHPRPNKALSSIQITCSRVIDYLQKICKNFFDLYKLPYDSSKSHEHEFHSAKEDEISRKAIANLSYLMFVENMAPSSHPQVFEHTYIFEMHINLITLLLSQNKNLVIYKGLHLCSNLLNRLQDCELPTRDSKMKEAVLLSKSFFDVAVYSPVEDYRILAVSLFMKYIKKYRWKERYILIMHMVTSFPHAGVQGLLVNMFKDFLYNEITEKREEKYFVGDNLISFMRVTVNLKDGVKSDILEDYDLILSCLNFVRFLILWDYQEKNITGFWTVAESVMKDYIEPLHQGIELSRAHYKLAVKDANKNHGEGPDAITSVIVNDENLPDLPPDYKTVVLEKAMLSLDMVESILSRVKELLEKKLLNANVSLCM